MADDAPEQSSKTEDPSQRKLEEARKRGDVVKSQEVTTWFMLAGSLLLISMMAPWTSAGLAESFTALLANADQYEVGGPAFGAVLRGPRELRSLMVALIPLAVLTVFAIAANLVQHRPLLSLDPITPKLSKISPIDGFRRLFSGEALVNFAKGLVKIAVVSRHHVLRALARARPARARWSPPIPALILGIFQELGIKIFGATLAVDHRHRRRRLRLPAQQAGGSARR